MYTTRILPLPEVSRLKPMRTRKVEAGVEVKTPLGQNLSVTAYWEKTSEGFGSSVDSFHSVIYPYWQAGDTFTDPEGRLSIDPSTPSRTDTLAKAYNVPDNSNYHSTWGVEFDFDLGRIAANCINTGRTLAQSIASDREKIQAGLDNLFEAFENNYRGK